MRGTAQLAVAILSLTVPWNPARAADVPCTNADPQVGRVVSVQIAQFLQVNRRGETVRLSIGDSICHDDVTVPGKAWAEVRIDADGRTVIIEPRHAIGFSDRDLLPAPSQGGAVAVQPNSRSPAPKIEPDPYSVQNGTAFGLALQYRYFSSSPTIQVREQGASRRSEFVGLVEDAIASTDGLRTPSDSPVAGANGLWPDEGTANQYIMYISERVAKPNPIASVVGGIIGTSPSHWLVGGFGRCQLGFVVDAKLVEASTGETIYANKLYQAVPIKNSCDEPSKDDLFAAYSISAQILALEAQSAVYPLKITSIDPRGTFFLSGTLPAIETGAVLAVSERPSEAGGKTGVAGVGGRPLGFIRVLEISGQTVTGVPLEPIVLSVPADVNVRYATDTELDDFIAKRAP